MFHLGVGGLGAVALLRLTQLHGPLILLPVPLLAAVRLRDQLTLRRTRLQQIQETRQTNQRLRQSSHQLEGLLTRLGSTPPPQAGSAAAERAPAGGCRHRRPIHSQLHHLASQLEGLLQAARALDRIDPLTLLPNRRQFVEQLEVEAARSLRAGSPFTVLLVDIDRFRNLSDTYGDAEAEQVLIAVARRLRQTVRIGDFLARQGHDQFTLLMDASAIKAASAAKLQAHAHSFANRLVEAFGESLDLGERRLHISVSVGVCVVEPGQGNGETVLRQLNAAVEQAKQQKYRRVALFDHEASGRGWDDYTLFSDLKEALRTHSLQMAFQPLVTASGSWDGLEALARWQHPTLGGIPPDRFITVAERYRLMNDLGEQIVALSLRGYQQIRQELDLKSLRLSINMSPSQLNNPELHQRLMAMVGHAGISPSLITLEITEMVVLERNEATQTNLVKLREAGFRISLDDFGTGHSSLNVLQALRPNEIKIDRSFMQGLGLDPYADQIVTVIASMAAHMDLDLVAEGVETADTFQTLRGLNIQYFQGYLFCRPMLTDDLIRFGRDRLQATPAGRPDQRP
ncbi:putative bifunctional diguanylate cyclase/phosphodiesterase [Aphanothece stagnina]